MVTASNVWYGSESAIPSRGKLRPVFPTTDIRYRRAGRLGFAIGRLSDHPKMQLGSSALAVLSRQGRFRQNLDNENSSEVAAIRKHPNDGRSGVSSVPATPWRAANRCK